MRKFDLGESLRFPLHEFREMRYAAGLARELESEGELSGRAHAMWAVRHVTDRVSMISIETLAGNGCW
jgi:hypothetical protein